MKLLSFFLILFSCLTTSAQSLSDYEDYPLTSMFDLYFTPADWRDSLGRPDIFMDIEGREERFFAYGAALQGVSVKLNPMDDGPYAMMDHQVNFMMLHDAEQAQDYITLSKGSGVLVWAYIVGLTSHEENLDTKVYYHLWIYLPDYPDTTHAEIFYVEDYRSGGTAEVFTLVPYAPIQIAETYGMMMISAKLAYNRSFGSEDTYVNLYLSGAVELQSFGE